MTADAKKPKGVGCVLTGPDGSVMAHAFDFDTSGMGGCKLWEAQRSRAEAWVAQDYIKNFAYGDLAKVIEAYHTREFVNKLCRDHGYKRTYVNVGWDGVDITR